MGRVQKSLSPYSLLRRHRGRPHVHWGCQCPSYFLETIPSEGSSPSDKALWHIRVTFRLFSFSSNYLVMEPRIISHKWPKQPQKQNASWDIATQCWTSKKKLKKLNLRTVWGSLFHLLSPMSLSYYSSFHLWLFLFSPHNSLLSWFAFSPLKIIFLSFSLCHAFPLHYGFTCFSHLFSSGHSHSFLAIVILSFSGLAL